MMPTYRYTGRLTNFQGYRLLESRQADLVIVPEQPAFGDRGPMTDQRIPVTVDSDGYFSVWLEASAATRPQTRYILRCEWIENGTVGWSEWARFYAPIGGGVISELLDLPTPPWAIAYGAGPPPEGQNGLYIDISGEHPVLYAPEGAGR